MSESPSSMVDRVVMILGVFERSAGPLNLGQISVRSGLPRSSVHRILQQLVSARLLSRDDNDYRLGLRMFEIGSLVVHRTRLSEVARPLLQELCAVTGHVVHLAMLDQQDVVYLEKVGGAFASTLPSRIGGRLPAHCTAVGKAILAHSPDEVVRDYLWNGLCRRTDASIATPQALYAALDRIRGAGYATEAGEAVAAVSCVAAPVLVPDQVLAGISVCGPRERVHVDALKFRVKWTAAEISRRLRASGTRPQPRTRSLVTAVSLGGRGPSAVGARAGR